MGTVTGTDKTRDEIADEVRERLNDELGDRLLIESATIPVINFDQETQERINRYQTEIGNTRIAEQRKLTAAAEAEANTILAESVSEQPNVLVSRCLDTMSETVSRGQTNPVGSSCWPGGTNSAGVLVDNTTEQHTAISRPLAAASSAVITTQRAAPTGWVTPPRVDLPR